MVRRLAFGYVLIASVWCAQAFALGLGDITIHSSLNQKLDAEINLLDTHGMSESDILAQLATAEDFKRVGVDRFFFLTGLQFHVQMGDQNHPVLHVTSAQPITEPYLDFLVQVIWPNGRLLKEYTVLLDPPTYKNQAAPAVASPGRSDPGGGSAGRVERTPTRPDSQVSLSSAPRSNPPAAQSPPLDRLTGDSYGVTDRDDTLWQIARRSRPADGISVQQNMLAIERLNPEAFIGGNINLLKAGYTLRLPKEADVQAISAADAVAEVASQNEAWQAYRRGEGLPGAAATNTTAAAAPPAESQSLAGQVDATTPKASKAAASGPEGELRIIAGDAGDHGTAAGGSSADAAALQGELAAAKAEAERAAQERDEAVAKLDKVTSQAEQAQRQIEVRNQQLAQMQAQLKAAKQAQVAAAPVASKSESSGIAAALASPFVWGGAAIVLVLLIVAGLSRSRARRREEDDQLAAFNEPMRVAPAVAALGKSADDEDTADAEAEGASPQPDDDVEHELVHAEGAQTSDVIGEADIYIAYGRYPQAVSLLLGALDDHPDRSDVRVKLLEVYAETKDEAGFETHMHELLARCDDNELLLEARELEAKLREDGPLSTAVSSVEPGSSATLDDDFQLDLEADDDNAADAEHDIDHADAFSEREEVASDDLGGDLGIDFKADEQPTVLRPQVSAAQAETDTGDVAVATDNGDEFDLEDLEFEPPARARALGEPHEAQAAEEPDDAFEFLNEEDAATTKLDLARAYIDMGDEDGAREILGEVLQEGSNDQQATATELLAKLG